ncbi:MAG: sigma-70 family RNA polymerase sigma factor [Candidatus Omnitrophica bacterium]|nr:sigma-70 family RNA polymerase sigma factor [Candidatus Omnitrophota bacterium]MDD5553506.1 sigma-70 family RNA polymerase sigma factor [Candidatus Omnitrophota bacterium]
MNDLEFVRRCVSGDKQAWEEFVERYSSLIYNYIHGVLRIKGHSYTQEHVKDLFQEIFLSLSKDNFRKLKTFKAKNGCSLASWLRQVTVNFTIDYTRKFRPALSIDQENEDGFSLADVLPCDAPLPGDSLRQEEILKHLTDCIGKLDTDDKYFLELSLNRGFEPEKLVRHLRISRGAVDMRKCRIVQRLRECFEKKGILR